METEFAKAAKMIAGADALLISAGAGMGVDSGLPDFRGTEGFWKAYPPYRHLGLSFAELANPVWFTRKPELAWGFYGHRLNLYRKTVPHAGFAILRKWASRMPLGTHVFTSNVDGQFQKAGFLPEAVTEVHGSIHHLQCAADCPSIWSAEGTTVEVDPATFRARGPLPACPNCGGMARPNIHMFGDGGWISERTDEQMACLDGWLRNIKGKRIVVIECGAGTVLATVRSFSEYVAASDNSTLIRINLREPQVRGEQIAIASGALEALAAIDAA
jgi:NAD-dependent SIR2 family protein deacetylase